MPAFLLLITCFTISVAVISCTNHNEEELYPCNVETVPVTYRNTIALIIERNCDDACHGIESDRPLKYYEGLKNYADSEILIGVLRHAPGYPPMPQGKPPLLECDILKIEKWISEGAHYN